MVVYIESQSDSDADVQVVAEDRGSWEGLPQQRILTGASPRLHGILSKSAKNTELIEPYQIVAESQKGRETTIGTEGAADTKTDDTPLARLHTASLEAVRRREEFDGTLECWEEESEAQAKPNAQEKRPEDAAGVLVDVCDEWEKYPLVDLENNSLSGNYDCFEDIGNFGAFNRFEDIYEESENSFKQSGESDCSDSSGDYFDNDSDLEIIPNLGSREGSGSRKRRRDSTSSMKLEWPKSFCCSYLLQSISRPSSSYIGFAIDPRRRIRQHNGDLNQGGARRTKPYRPWQYVACVYGFPSKIDAMQFEWAWQHPTRSKKLQLSSNFGLGPNTPIQNDDKTAISDVEECEKPIRRKASLRGGNILPDTIAVPNAFSNSPSSANATSTPIKVTPSKATKNVNSNPRSTSTKKATKTKSATPSLPPKLSRSRGLKNRIRVMCYLTGVPPFVHMPLNIFFFTVDKTAPQQNSFEAEEQVQISDPQPHPSGWNGIPNGAPNVISTEQEKQKLFSFFKLDVRKLLQSPVPAPTKREKQMNPCSGLKDASLKVKSMCYTFVHMLSGMCGQHDRNYAKEIRKIVESTAEKSPANFPHTPEECTINILASDTDNLPARTVKGTLAQEEHLNEEGSLCPSLKISTESQNAQINSVKQWITPQLYESLDGEESVWCVSVSNKEHIVLPNHVDVQHGDLERLVHIVKHEHAMEKARMLGCVKPLEKMQSRGYSSSATEASSTQNVRLSTKVSKKPGRLGAYLTKIIRLGVGNLLAPQKRPSL